MRVRFRWLGTALLTVTTILVVILFVVFRVAGPPRWPEGAIFVPRDAETIQAALELASPGSTIVLQVRDEAFQGPVDIVIADVTIAAAGDGVRLNSSGSEPAAAIRADGAGGSEALRKAIAEGDGPLTILCAASSLPSLPPLPQRRDVGLAVFNATDADLARVAQLTDLTSLCIAGGHVADLAPLTTVGHLTSLDLRECQDVDDLTPLAALTNLASLHIEWTTVQDLGPPQSLVDSLFL